MACGWERGLVNCPSGLTCAHSNCETPITISNMILIYAPSHRIWLNWRCRRMWYSNWIAAGPWESLKDLSIHQNQFMVGDTFICFCRANRQLKTLSMYSDDMDSVLSGIVNFCWISIPQECEAFDEVEADVLGAGTCPGCRGNGERAVIVDASQCPLPRGWNCHYDRASCDGHREESQATQDICICYLNTVRLMPSLDKYGIPLNDIKFQQKLSDGCEWWRSATVEGYHQFVSIFWREAKLDFLEVKQLIGGDQSIAFHF